MRLVILVLAVFVLLLAGCAVTPESNVARSMIVRNAIVYPALEKGANADRIRAVADAVRDFVQGETSLSNGALRAFVERKITEQIAGDDQLLALELQDGLSLLYTPGLDLEANVSDETRQRVIAYVQGVKSGVERWLAAQ